MTIDKHSNIEHLPSQLEARGSQLAAFFSRQARQAAKKIAKRYDFKSQLPNDSMTIDEQPNIEP